MNLILSALFPPKMGKIENVQAVVLRHQIETGVIKIFESDTSWAGNTRMWRNGRWHQIRRDSTGFE